MPAKAEKGKGSKNLLVRAVLAAERDLASARFAVDRRKKAISEQQAQLKVEEKVLGDAQKALEKAEKAIGG